MAAFDVYPLPSGGLTYPDVDGKKINEIKIYDVTVEDEDILLAPNLVNSGEMLNMLVKEKTNFPFDIGKMVLNDFIFVVFMLRYKMNPLYNFTIKNPKTNENVEVSKDLSDFDVIYIDDVCKNLDTIPTENGLFPYILNDGTKILIKIQTIEDSKNIKVKSEVLDPEGEKMGLRRIILFKELIEQFGDITDKEKIAEEVKKIRLVESRKISKFMDDMSKSIDFSMEVETETGDFRADMPITTNFFYFT